MSQDIPGWDKPEKKEPDGPRGERISGNSQSVRVPEKVVRGVFATGFVVYTGQNEFVMDFYQGIAKPPQVVARVVMSLGALEGLINLLRDQMGGFAKHFGQPTAVPKAPNDRQLSIQELYDELKIPEELASGNYATGLMVNFNPVEFHFDFVTGFFPNASVSSRVYLAAPRVQNMIDALTNTQQNMIKQRMSQQPQLPGGANRPPEPPQTPPNPMLNNPDGPGRG